MIEIYIYTHTNRFCFSFNYIVYSLHSLSFQKRKCGMTKRTVSFFNIHMLEHLQVTTPASSQILFKDLKKKNASL